MRVRTQQLILTLKGFDAHNLWRRFLLFVNYVHKLHQPTVCFQHLTNIIPKKIKVLFSTSALLP